MTQKLTTTGHITPFKKEQYDIANTTQSAKKGPEMKNVKQNKQEN